MSTTALNAYAGPVVEQAVNQLVQPTPLEQVNEKIHEITELVRGHLQDFLSIYGVAARVRAVGAGRGAVLRRDEDG